jgi:hypothetical protein
MEIAESIPGIYQLHGFGDDILAAFSGRQFPNRAHLGFLTSLGFSKDSLVHYRQVHGKDIVGVNSKRIPEGGDADGMFTQRKGIVLGILTADCVPVFFYEKKSKTVGIVHAGWRGTYQRIAVNMVEVIRLNFNASPESILVAFGPAIRSCCYEVGPEFRGFFPGHYFEKVVQKESSRRSGFVDLIGAIKGQLFDEGIIPDHIFDPGICTSCQNENFFSYRREHTGERMLSVIGIRE